MASPGEPADVEVGAVIKYVRGWNASETGILNEAIDLPLVAAALIAEVIAQLARWQALEPLGLNARSEPLPSLEPPLPLPIGTRPCLLPFSKGPNHHRRQSGGDV